MSNYFSYGSAVHCERCEKLIPTENIIWDHDYDYDGNDRVHTYGQYKCITCGPITFPTNDPDEDDENDN